MIKMKPLCDLIELVAKVTILMHWENIKILYSNLRWSFFLFQSIFDLFFSDNYNAKNRTKSNKKLFYRAFCCKKGRKNGFLCVKTKKDALFIFL